jgi:predicted transglutaminase-like cysteine proteinase
MPNKSVRKVMAAALVACGFTSGPEAGAAERAYMSVGQQTSQPIGHYEFCNARPEECAIRSALEPPMVLSPVRWTELQQVNSLVNAAIVPATDLEMFGVEERWVYPGTHGDCEDYVLLKRRILMEQGWPASALLITVVLRPDGLGHAVLTVRTDRGDLVLDNLAPNVRLWSETPYLYVKRQSEQNTGRWVSIDDGRNAVVRYVGE